MMKAGPSIGGVTFGTLLLVGAAWLPADDQPAGQNPPAAKDAADAKKSPDDGAAENGGSELPLVQEQVLRKYQRFEEVLLRMSELTAASDPKRAALLRKAVGQSKDKLIGVQFDRLVDLLKRDQLATAVTNQKEVASDLKDLLDLLLSEQRADRLKNERERIKEQIRRINELINKQQQLQGQTEGNADPNKLAQSQGKLSDQTGKLADEMKDASDADAKKPDERKSADDDESPDKQKGGKGNQGEQGDQQQAKGQNHPDKNDEKDPDKKEADDKPDGEKKPAGEPKPAAGEQKPQDAKPSDGEKQDGQPKQNSQQQKGEQQQGQQQSGESPQGEQEEDQPPPSDNEAARRRVREAQQAMDEARKKLEQAKREGATEDQEQARRKLEEAKARLEEVLRQLREEEVERSLALLEARFRKMLQMQTEVYEGTVRVDRVKPEDRTQNEEIEAGRLSRHERAILEELSGAEMLLREDGTSVAFPEAVQELREDMEQVAERLAEAKVDQITQLTEQDIIAALEEMVDAFKKAQKENEEKKQRQQQQAGEQQEPPLVDAIAELKMIRALQMRVNKRTANYGKLVDGEEGQAERAELLEALQKLSDREQRIYRTTRDIVLGKNQ